MKDVAYALRILRKTPLVSAIAILALALGIGANSAIFSVVNAVLLQPLPFPQPQQLVQVTRQYQQTNDQVWVSVPNFLDWQRQNTVFANMTAYQQSNFNLAAAGAPPLRVAGLDVDTNFLATLGLHPALGADFQPSDDQPGRPAVALISYGLFKSRFAGAPDAIGRAVQINGRPVAVLGVLPASFQFPGNPEMLEPLQPEGLHTGRSANVIHVIGRLKPGVALAAAQAQMHAIGSRLEQQYPKANSGESVGVVPLQQEWTGSLGPTLWMLLGAVGLVLLIACADLANLLLARSLGRSREMAVRMALGAERGRIVRQLLTESVVLALAGGLVGLAFAWAGLHALLAWAPASQAITFAPTVALSGSISLPVLLFTFVLAVVTGIIFGLAPALQTARTDLNATLQAAAGRSGSGSSGRKLRNLLVVAEIALTLPLLLGAALLLSSIAHLRNTDAGFNPNHMLVAHLALAPAQFPTTAAVAQFSLRLLPKLRAIPGVQSAALTDVLPLTLCPDFPFTIPGRSFSLRDLPDAEWHPSTPGSFAALGVPILNGRDFRQSDGAGAAPVAIINQAAAQMWWPHQNPIGQSLWIGKPVLPPALTDPAPRTIIAVVGNVRQNGLDAPPPPALYIPLAQANDAVTSLVLKIIPLSLVVRTAGSPDAIRAQVQQAIWSVNPEQPISDLLTMRQVQNATLGPHQFNFALLSIFAALALALAAVGIYGVMSYSVAERRREIGLRMALGASPGQLLGMVLREGLKLALAGIVLGAIAAWLLQRALAHQVSGLSGFSPALAVLTAAGLVAVTMLACFAPALRATRLDPQQALRQE